MNFKLVIISLILIPAFLKSQVIIDSILISDTIRQSLKHLNPDIKSRSDGSENIHNLLNEVSSGQIQISAPGGLTTFLHRGMGNRHLPVIWNGINIQSVVNGSYDLSLIPLTLFNNTGFYKFGTPALTGNNGFAGALNLSNNKSLPQSNIGIALSSLNNISLFGILHITKNNFSTQTGIEIAYHKNQFKFLESQQLKRREPTNLQKLNLTHQIKYFINNNQMLTFNIWLQSSRRLILPSITAAHIFQEQIDINTRINLVHASVFKKSKLSTSFSYMKEQLDFKSPSIDSRSDVNIFILNTEWSEYSKNGILASINYRKDYANANFYTDVKNRSTFQFAASKSFSKKDFTTKISVRQDLVDMKLMPTSISIFSQKKNLEFQLSSNYNLPSFNDLYWPGSGNISLKTEKSYQGELGYGLNYKNLKLKILTYGNYVSDWIQWIPQLSGNWSPVNQKKVLSRGLEILGQTNWTFMKWMMEGRLSYHFNKTTAIDHYYETDLKGKQLIYVPKQKLNTVIKAKDDKNEYCISYHLTGKRYDTPDNEYELAPIHIFNAHYKLFLKRSNVCLEINNITNRRYSIVRFFPMPGIHLNVIFKFLIH